MMPKIQLNEIQSAEDLRNFFLGNKQELRWMFWEHYTPYHGAISGRSRVEWTCKETGGEVMLNDIGEKHERVLLFFHLRIKYKANLRICLTKLT